VKEALKRLAKWAAVCISVVGVQLYFTHKFLAPYLRANWYGIYWSNSTDSASGWPTMAPRYAWPILVTYGGALVALAVTAGLFVWYYMMQRERRAIASREAAVGLQEEQVRVAVAKAERIRKAAENREQEAREEIARCKQEAAAQIKEANDRLQGSVNTNIGRQRTIQKLRKRVKELGGEGEDANEE